MENETTTPNRYAESTAPAEPKKIRRVGTTAFALLLIAAGVLLLAQQFVPQFDLLSAAKFAPALLILLGIEMLIFAAKPGMIVKFDWLSLFGCAFILGTVGVAAVLPMFWSTYGPEHERAEDAARNQLCNTAYEALSSDPELKSKIVNLYAQVDLGDTYQKTGNFGNGDTASLDITLTSGYADAETFAADCLNIAQKIKQSGQYVSEYDFASDYGDDMNNGTRYTMRCLPAYLEGLTAEQAAKRVNVSYLYEDSEFAYKVDRDETARATLRQEILDEYRDIHGEDANPGDAYLAQETERRFAELFGIATPETAQGL